MSVQLPTQARVVISGGGIAGLVEFAGRLQGKPPFPPARAIAASEGLSDAGTQFVEKGR